MTINGLLDRAVALETAARASEAGTVAARLTASVIRPLKDVAAGDPARSCAGIPEALDGAIAGLAADATALRAGAAGPPELLEATAALQDLARELAPDADTAAARVRRWCELQSGVPAAIEPAVDGPYLVTNAERLEDWLGSPIDITPQMALCRCGRSQRKPLCDGSHAGAFSDAKDPDRVPDRRDSYVGQQLTVFDNRGICQHSGYCTDRIATAFRAGREPFVAPSGGRMDELIRAVRDCPSGALSYAVDDVEARAQVDHHDARPPLIQVTRDGPYRVTGAIPLVDADGAAVARAEGASTEHYALCRCGRSQNKPFCSGMHWYVDFKDPVRAAQDTPSVYEWAGGLPALTRMTRLFYEKHVPADPLLAPLFSNMSADHPERVAKWLGEVFGGPPSYSEQYGGYPRMLSQHVGRNLQEGWRQRWVQLLLRSAEEAGLPNDAEFRAAFSSYIEWGSRLAVENSQTDATPPPKMPMPHWDWSTAAGPPGSRAPAPASPGAQDAPVVLPGADDPVSFDVHVKTLFRASDRRSMSFAFDLWDHGDVSRHAEPILARLRDGSMPCDGAWPPEWVAVFQRWTETGMAP